MRRVLPVAPLLTACTLAHVNDIRLDAVRRPTVVQRELLRRIHGPGAEETGAVAILSSSHDLRLQLRRTQSVLSVSVVRCEGRSHIHDDDPLGPIVAHDNLWDARGPLWRAEEQHDAPPDQPRYLYWLPIGLLTPPSELRNGATGALLSWSVDHDLRRDAEDLCAYLRGGVFALGAWRTNTVVIPHAAIRAAVAERAR